MKIVGKITNWLKGKSQQKQGGFTLPEVIVSFSILVMVITSATGILVTVIRTNADNVSNLVADGLAQEGLDAVRFVRDSNTVLGLEFNGGQKGLNATKFIWGEALFDTVSAEPKFFTLQVKNANDLNSGCSAVKASSFDKECLPIQLKNVQGDAATLETADETLVYRKNNSDAAADKGLIYFQNDSASTDANMTGTEYHRFIRIEPIRDSAAAANAPVDKLRVSSEVAWLGQNGQERRVVLTTELTDWK